MRTLWLDDIEGTLVWALALLDGDIAWDEWKKNSLACHAAAYPHLWFGIWSGPDTYHSVQSYEPGGAVLDFPVMNMHPHAWPLYSSAKLLGLEFHENGVSFRPPISLPDFEFSSSLLGFKKASEGGYSGWYAPTSAGTWEISIYLRSDEPARIKDLIVNDLPTAPKRTKHGIHFSGASHLGSPLKWQLG